MIGRNQYGEWVNDRKACRTGGCRLPAMYQEGGFCHRHRVVVVAPTAHRIPKFVPVLRPSPARQGRG